MLNVKDFNIGDKFIDHEANTWRVTDIGTRVIVAIKVSGASSLDLVGVPYSVAEIVWDEYDLEAIKGKL